MLSFIPMVAAAQTAGCYVSASNPTACHDGEISCSTDYNTNLSTHGYTIARICYYALDIANEAVQCNARYDALVTNRDQWVAYSNSQAALIRRLRKACGSKCRAIK
jgi:hypothetical protein